MTRAQPWTRRWSRHGPPLPLAEAMEIGPKIADEGDCEVLVVALGCDPNEDGVAERGVRRRRLRERGLDREGR